MTDTQEIEAEPVSIYHPLSDISLSIQGNIGDFDAFLELNTRKDYAAGADGSILLILLDDTETAHLVRMDAAVGGPINAVFMHLEDAANVPPVRLKVYSPSSAGDLTFDEEDYQTFNFGDGCLQLLYKIDSEQHLLQVLHHAPNHEKGRLFEPEDVVAFSTSEDWQSFIFHIYRLHTEDDGLTWKLQPLRFVEDDDADLPETKDTALQAST